MSKFYEDNDSGYRKEDKDSGAYECIKMISKEFPSALNRYLSEIKEEDFLRKNKDG